MFPASPTPEFLDWARDFVAARIPALDGAELAGGRSCLYTNMADMEGRTVRHRLGPGVSEGADRRLRLPATVSSSGARSGR